ncbi:hypothetical protein [Edaphobacter aggregans]|uniref:hypothetical protein n=1 Tax=Edaphobacter aggregans TaxID=570835 RepID=UPI0012FB9FC1|nr:hypothetical protein [Edaphobacter aggregans]
MRRSVLLLVVLAVVSSGRVWGQAREIPSAAPAQATGSPEEQGRKLLDEMVEALGGQAWKDRKDMQVLGRTAAFFRGQPNGTVIEYTGWRRFPDATQGGAERIGFLSDKSMILPGKKIDIVQIWTADNGYEVTYKGRTTMPKEIVEDYQRRKKHSIESVVNDWLKAPGVMILSEGSTMVDRRIAEKVTVLSADNDAVTIELDAATHLPLRRAFRFRNPQFNDFDEDAETYSDYHTVQGLPTAYNVARYKNGEMVNQRFLMKVEYNMGLSAELFNPDNLLKKK